MKNARVESGKFKGKRLFLPSFATTRSTKSRVKACVFNTLRGELMGKIFIEVFGGSGAMAFEALSNYALGAIIIEKDAKAYKIACENAKMLLGGENLGNFSYEALNSSGNLGICDLQALNLGENLGGCDNVNLKFNGNLGKFKRETLNSNENLGICDLNSLNFGENLKKFKPCGSQKARVGDLRNKNAEFKDFGAENSKIEFVSQKFANHGAKGVFSLKNARIYNADSFELLPVLFADEKFSQMPVIAYFDPPFHLRNGFDDIYERVFDLINSLQSANLQGLKSQNSNLKNANLQNSNSQSLNSQPPNLRALNLKNSNSRNSNLQNLNSQNLNLQAFIIEHSSQISTPATLGIFTQYKFKKFGNTNLSFYRKI